MKKVLYGQEAVSSGESFFDNAPLQNAGHYLKISSVQAICKDFEVLWKTFPIPES